MTVKRSVRSAPVFGRSAHPVTCPSGLVIGDGRVYPEANYALAPTRLTAETFPEVREEYRRMASAVVARAEALRAPGIVLELEQPFELTLNPSWGAAVTADTRKILNDAGARSGLPGAIRVTVADIRDRTRPPRMRTGGEIKLMDESFAACAAAGADILSIESTGGKEVTDEALQAADVPALMFGLCVLGGRDMAFLWERISDIAKHAKVLSGGDSACGFGNTAMRLADIGYVPRVLAAIVRAASAARSLVAYEHGAVGPSKDCAYEGIYLKAHLGIPIALEGKSAACAHFSHIGNIAQAYADLWSNESVQNVRLLSGFAPEVFAEVLLYDCRLMNEALHAGKEMQLRDWLIASDAALDPQAFVLAPPVVSAVAAALEEGRDCYSRGVVGAKAAAAAMDAAAAADKLAVSGRERTWLTKLRHELDALPATAEALAASIDPSYLEKVLPEEYGLKRGEVAHG